ncbi:hypothetical protein MSTO_09580 [Mycobacterium stomatepiae]|uniref:Uncharacterized protein n=1 Tax=Mycobacterium stomatepiae TaxID=470076 RepID=A0A7I7Q360_9MYCO|nr:hypothetical protein MSTO_09580 [Mycobacterium stomatepiae]
MTAQRNVDVVAVPALTETERNIGAVAEICQCDGSCLGTALPELELIRAAEKSQFMRVKGGFAEVNRLLK